MMWRYYTLLSFTPRPTFAMLKAEVQAGRTRRTPRVQLARRSRRDSSAAAADAAEQDFQRRAAGGVPMRSGSPARRRAAGHRSLLKQAGLVPSTSEGLRMVEQGVSVSTAALVSDKGLKVEAGTLVVQVGKRKFARVTLTA